MGFNSFPLKEGLFWDLRHPK